MPIKTNVPDTPKSKMRFGSKLQIFGWLWMPFGSTLTVIVLAFLFPKTMMPIVYAYLLMIYLGEICIILGYQMNKNFEGRKPVSMREWGRLIRSLSTPQVLFLLGGLAAVFSVYPRPLGLHWMRTFESVSLLAFTAGALIFVFRVLARFILGQTVAAMKKSDVSSSAAPAANNPAGAVNGPAKTADSTKIRPNPLTCSRCGKNVSTADDLINGLCLTCLDKLTDPVGSQLCCVCGDLREEDEMIYCDGKYYCVTCFQKVYGE